MKTYSPLVSLLVVVVSTTTVVVDAYVQTKAPPTATAAVVIPPSARPHASFKRRVNDDNKTRSTTKRKTSRVVQVQPALITNAKTMMLLNQASFYASQGGTTGAIRTIVERLSSQQKALGERVSNIDLHITQLLSNIIMSGNDDQDDDDDMDAVRLLKSIYTKPRFSHPLGGGKKTLDEPKMQHLLELSRVCSRDECNTQEKEQVLDELIEQRLVSIARMEEMFDLLQVLTDHEGKLENKYAYKAYNFN